MKAREENGVVTKYPELPRVWGQHINFQSASTGLLKQEGFFDVETPSFDAATHHLGVIYFDQDNEVFTYPLRVLTEEEINIIAIENIKQAYQTHKENGWQAYQDFRAAIVVDITKGVIDEAQAFMIESFLGVAYNRISNTGDWKTAYYELSQVSELPTFVQPYYDTAMGEIANYIGINYN